ncbi:glycosyltransferase family 4 protein [Ureibacillus sinduriensis]|uniref:Glycosyl transferase n=1 Tax=Ureibacillus sinduriensis BLB-1 = JCM 15800 TaxID=1384057 RepID=A0A0A3IGL0_9BACL|nr:glycosyltransferase family 4 protein [Ureibacillus sinduriensis]KGR73972.1 glycosyl transferase [Ureibacillus sinduriensis BLB-1 = JCM 15800]
MKVCHLTSVHPHNDTRIFVKECCTLAENGFSVTLIAPGAPDESIKGVHLIGVDKVKGNRVKRMTQTTKAVYEKALAVDADIYHFHDPELIPVGLKLKRKGKIIIYDVHEDVPRQILSKNWIPKLFRTPIAKFFERYESDASRKFDAIVTATMHIEDRFKNYNKETYNINNFPSLKEMDFKIGTPPKKEAVCYVGGITKVRGAFEMTEMLGIVNQKRNLRLKLAGPIDQKITPELTNHKNWSYVDYKGVLDRKGVKEVLTSSKIGLVTLHPIINYLDALPVKMFEYMAAGIPVIASDFPLWREIVGKANCGVLVDPLNPTHIAEAVESLLKDEQRAKTMGENGRHAVEQEYNWEKEGQKLVKLYQSFQ